MSENTRNIPSGRRFWIAQLIFWTVFWAFDVLQGLEYRRLNELDPAVTATLLKSLMPTGLGLTITSCFRYLFVRIRHYDEKLFITVAFIACVLGSFIFAAGHYELKHIFGIYDSTQIFYWKKWGAYAPSRFIILAIWTGLFLYLLYAGEAARQRARLSELETAASRARSEMLRYQVNPHLLFNALNTVSGHVLNNDMQTADRAIQSLSDLLRCSLSDGDATSITLEQEIARVGLYLDVERTRFGDDLKTRFIIPDELKNIQLPPLLLQPLVENAMKHGLSRSAKGGEITVSARQHDGHTQIVVRNEIPENSLLDYSAEKPASFGVGLKNVAERLDMFFDGDTSLEITEDTKLAFSVVLTFPSLSHGATQ
ncbi:histidine kinase [Hyphococcus flavus]|uniref:Histidine kinase n=1 Tax=Hyphococcus flavus TaxID=1866326 RepID=A0AAF0CEH2_9PROT|nr:histidine kinase [Hyphococcus flavus]WDI30164.1 histidine kinase [Hyphococcus flavus]